jgi:formyltetrahydrofolate dehydrogenase
MELQVYKLLRTQGHSVVAVFTVPDIGGRPDPLAEVAEEDGVPVLKFKQWRKKGEIIPEVRSGERVGEGRERERI